jgi:CheY-like chemotaxis protein
MLRRGKQRKTATSVHTIDTKETTTTTSDTTAAPQVLIVDDEAVIRDALRWLFEDAGYVVQEAADGSAALDLLAASTTRLVVLLDLKMPGMSGYEVLRLLADKPGWSARHAFIVMSAMSGPLRSPDVLPLLKQLSISLVSKPFEVEEVLAAVDTEAARLSAMTAHDADADATA